MADKTKIEWTDATVNAINGCSVTSPGCKFCYAMKQAHRVDVRRGLTAPTSGGMVWTGEVRFNEKALMLPLGWKRPRTIFWNAHGDMFHENVPDEWIDRCFAVMALTPHHRHQVLTKRSARMREYISSPRARYRIARMIIDMLIAKRIKFDEQTWPVISEGDSDEPSDILIRWPLPNVWLGVSVEDQRRADERIPDLLATPAAVRFLSCEPLLGPVDMTKITLRHFGGMPTDLSQRLGDYVQPLQGNFTDSPRIDWVIVGGESGPGARPMHPDWARSIRNQCAAAGVPFHFKQWGEWLPWQLEETGGWGWLSQKGAWAAGRELHLRRRNGKMPKPWSDELQHGFGRECLHQRVGKRAAGRLLDGVTHDGMPA